MLFVLSVSVSAKIIFVMINNDLQFFVENEISADK